MLNLEMEEEKRVFDWSTLSVLSDMRFRCSSPFPTRPHTPKPPVCVGVFE